MVSSLVAGSLIFLIATNIIQLVIIIRMRNKLKRIEQQFMKFMKEKDI